MAMELLVFVCSSIFFHHISPIQASTHWVVTEDGRIQAQMDSIFSLRRPYDLVALLKQEERATMLENLKQELLRRKEEIDKNEDKDTGLEQRFYKTDPDCVAAGKALPDFDLYISTVLPLENKGIRPEEHINFKASPSATPAPPYCTDVMDLHYSIHAYEHLEGIKERANLSGTPELGLKNAITHRDNVDDYGHLIFEAMKKNATSWVLYNMAAFYWRIKGDPYHVIECLRRALHFSPRMQKDVALISLANVLHRARYSNEAAIVVHAALDVSKELNVNHFTLGNIYAVLAEYNKSVICFENTLKIQPDFEAASKRKHAVKCHAKLEGALEAQHRSLQRTLDELKDYQKKHDNWQVQQEKMLTEQAPPNIKLDQRIAYEQQKIRESAIGMGEYCQMIEKDGRQLLKCSWGRKQPVHPEFDLWGFNSKWSDKEQGEKKGSQHKPSVDYFKPVHDPVFTKKRRPTAAEEAKLVYKQKGWPSKTDCDKFAQKFPAKIEFPTTYLSPENKGFEVKALLTEAQGLKKGQEHPLPWYPPVCVTLLPKVKDSPKTYDHIQSVQDRTKVPLKLFDSSMKQMLLSHVDDELEQLTEEEVGQRILTALKKEIGPSWIMYNLAGLYWRILGNSYHGIECVRRALLTVPDQYKDVPLVNLANILYKWGRVDDAILIMRDAVAVSDVEPETHFFLANMLSAKGNLSGAIDHYEEVLWQQPDHQNAFNMLRVVKCYQKFHHATQSAAPKDTKQANSPSCQKGAAPAVPSHTDTESRVVCKKENGKETCVVETRTRSKNSKCEGGCVQTQTCSITPIKVEACTNTEGTVTIEHPENCNGNKCATFGQHTAVNLNGKSGGVTPQDQCGQPSPHQPDLLSAGLANPISFNAKLDEVSNYYKKKGLCSGDDCHRLMVQCYTPMRTSYGVAQAVSQQQFVFKEAASLPPQQCMLWKIQNENREAVKDNFWTMATVDVQGHATYLQNLPQKPHIRLEMINGILHQKLIFVDAPSDIVVNPTDCVIFNDGSKSGGCTREEYKPYDLEELSQIISKPLNTVPLFHGNNEQSSEENILNCKNKLSEKSTDQSRKDEVVGKGSPATEEEETFSSVPTLMKEPAHPALLKEPIEPALMTETSEPALTKETSETSLVKEKVDSSHGAGKSKDSDKVTVEEEEKQPVFDLSKVKTITEEDLPDPSGLIQEIMHLSWPAWKECVEEMQRPHQQINFKVFTSSWVSVSLKGVDLSDHIDFNSKVKPKEEPLCDPALINIDKLQAITYLGGAVQPEKLRYSRELSLKEALQKLGGSQPQPVWMVGTRIAKALKKKPESWVLNNIAALYWRVQGNAVNAVRCIHVALSHSPQNVKDIALHGLANILHNSNRLNEAVVVNSLALQVAPRVVLIHFTMANIYAAKGNFAKASKFYEATLGLQASFEPAKIRLRAIQCDTVFKNPKLYKDDR